MILLFDNLSYPNLSIKSAWSSQCRVNSIWSVCRSNNDKLASSFQTIKKSKKLGNNSILLFIPTASSLWTQSIKFINE